MEPKVIYQRFNASLSIIFKPDIFSIYPQSFI
jgi:hypothetical protein